MRQVGKTVLGDISSEVRFRRGAYALTKSCLSAGLMGVDGGAGLG